MAKSKQQIKKFVSQCKFQTSDWVLVRSECIKLCGKGYVKKAQNPKSEATYEEFQQWLNGELSVGTVVKYGNTVGVLGIVTPERTGLSAYYIRDKKKILIHQLLINPEQAKVAPLDVANKFFNDLLQAGFVLDEESLNLVEAYTPKVGTYVKVISGDQCGVGVVSKITTDLITFLAFVCDKKSVIRDYSIKLQPNIHFKALKTEEVKSFDSILKENGMIYKNNSLLKVIEKVKLGETYYYITDAFKVKTGVEMKTRLCDNRYRIGNYFSTFEEAVKYCQKIQTLFQERVKLD